MSSVKIKVNKGVNFMYPFLTSQITILNVAEIVHQKSGKTFANVLFTDDRGNPVNTWFPSDFLAFAQDHVGKTVTATFRFYRGFGDRPASLSGISLS